ncbi:peptidase inhibitor 16 isoform X1 [Marmota monax]|uniref:Peptidase inhibitor 16 n=1 Tax=Marmota monax TaxID=9995 RepID=A0A5E4BB35_MARMO|nr:peptidase inhibitor 16 isoform X1 [Marmota monax]KAF7486838.1 peptidase inhibitor 16 [Marmota monax]VTJ66535.1 Hypothetical predicted protein [Marmota monax]
MYSSCSLRALLLLPPLLLVATPDPARALTKDEQRAMVELHNLYRAQVFPPASDMRRMRWDPELAAFAKAYAQQCVWGHNKERGRRGENLFAITDEGLDVPLAMEEWHHEREHYNLSAAACTPGQMCGHYTQVVWGKTERIGCGSHFCEKLQGVEETNIHLLVCNYEPPGNVKGQRPYQEGIPCSQCPPDYRCENSLCEPISGPEEEQDLPSLETAAPSTRATEASGSRKAGAPSPATEVAHSWVTEVSGSPATQAPPTVETKTRSSSATKEPSATATEAPPSLTSEVPSASTAHDPLSLDEGPVTVPKSTHVSVPKYADKVESETRAPSISPEKPLYPEMSLTGTRESLPHAQEEAEAEAEAEAELLPSSEILVSDIPDQDKPDELQATLDHTGQPSSKSRPNVPNAPSAANARGGRTLALQSSLPGTESREWRLSSGHMWGPSQGLLLLSPLMLAGLF